MKYWFLVFMAVGLNSFGQTEFVAKVRTIAEEHSDIKTMVVVYNARNNRSPQIQSSVGDIQILEVGIKSVSDVSRSIVNNTLKKNEVQALLLLDDEGKLVTNKRTISYLMKQAPKYRILVFSDSREERDAKVHGRVVREGEKWRMEQEQAPE